MEGNGTAKQKQTRILGQGPACSNGSGEDKRGWGRPDEGLLPLVASRLQKRDVGPARLVCRQWAAGVPEGCTRLEVKGKGPDGWELRYCGLEELKWVSPENVGQSWPKLRSLQLNRCGNGDLQMLRGMPGLASLSLPGCDIIRGRGAQGAKTLVQAHLPRPATLLHDNG